METTLIFHPAFPPALVFGVAATAAALVVAVYVRAPGRRWVRGLLAGVRLAAIVALGIILLRPMRLESGPRPGNKPVFNILVDASCSMATNDVDGGTRYAAVAQALGRARPALERALGERYDVKWYTFANRLQASTFEAVSGAQRPTGIYTDLGSALLEVSTAASSRPTAGVLLLSDGRDNAGGNVAQAATLLKSQKTPVWTAPVGSDTAVRDVYLTAHLSQDYLFVGQPATLDVAISQSGFANRYAQVRLYRDDTPDVRPRTCVSTQQVLLKDGGSSLQFPLNEDHKGVFRYRVEVAPLPDEADANNNGRTVFARVVDEKSKVLVVEARPYWDTKFMVRALRRDPNLDVTSVFQLASDKVYAVSERNGTEDAPGARLKEGVTIPRTRAELYQYDCLVFGRGIDELLAADELTLLKDYLLERGGSVVFARGKAYGFDTAGLAALEPLVWGDERVRNVHLELTPDGRVNPAFGFGPAMPADAVVRELPDMISITQVKAEKSLSVILARSEGGATGTPMAAICYQRYGKGKVMSIGATGLWRWALTTPDLERYEDVYARFWSQMVQWLISESDFLPGQEIAFRTDRYAYGLGDQVRFTVNTRFVDERDFQPEVTLTAPGGKRAIVPLEPSPGEPGAYAATYVPETEGEFTAELKGAPGTSAPERAGFTVYSESVENRYVAANPDLMRQIASITGGETLELDRLDQLPELVRVFERQSRVEVKPRDAWDRLPVFLAVVAVLAAEWFLRRRTGMV